MYSDIFYWIIYRLATGTSQAAPTAATQYMTAAEPYLAAAASNNIGPVPGYGVSLSHHLTTSTLLNDIYPAAV